MGNEGERGTRRNETDGGTMASERGREGTRVIWAIVHFECRVLMPDMELDNIPWGSHVGFSWVPFLFHFSLGTILNIAHVLPRFSRPHRGGSRRRSNLWYVLISSERAPAIVEEHDSPADLASGSRAADIDGSDRRDTSLGSSRRRWMRPLRCSSRASLSVQVG